MPPPPPPPPKGRAIGNPKPLAPKQTSTHPFPQKSQKDIAEEYRALAAAAPPGVKALHTRRVSTSSRTTKRATSSRPLHRSFSGPHSVNNTQPLQAHRPVDKGVPPTAIPNHSNEVMAHAANHSGRNRSPGQSGHQALRRHQKKVAECTRITTGLQIDVGPAIHHYLQVAAALSQRKPERVRRLTSMYVSAARRKRQELLVLPKEIHLSPNFFYAWQGAECWEELYVSHTGKIRAGVSARELEDLFQVGHILIQETWRAMEALFRVADAELVRYCQSPEEYEIQDGAPSAEAEQEELIEVITDMLEKATTSAAAAPQQTFVRNLLTRLRSITLQRKPSKGKKCKGEEAVWDPSFELIEDFNLCKISGATLRPGFHRRTASDLICNDLDLADDFDVMQLNLSLRASRLIFANIAANFKTTPYRRPEQRTDIIRDDKGFIIFITAPELVRRLTDRFEVRDPDTIAVMDTFFMFFRDFLTPKDLFRLLKARFEEKPPIVLEKDKKADWDRYQTVVKLHVVRMLAIWLDRYYLAAYDKHVLNDMFLFLNQITVDRYLPEHAATLLLTHLQACRKGERGQEHTEAFDKIVKLGSTNTPHFPLTAFEPFLPTLQDALNKSRTLPDIMIFTKPDGAEELVRAFTEIESSFFHRCLPKDLMTCDEQNSHPVFDKMNRWSHAVNLWVSRCILERRDTEARARIFELFIEVAVGCQQLRNYSSAMSLFLALEASRITRLTQMMDEVSDRHKAMLAGIKDFFGFSGSKQWQHYRDDLRATFGPAVPVLVAVKSDIIKVKAAREIARNKYQPMTGLNGPSGQIVDLMMYKKLREIVRELENCYADYEMPKDRFVTRWLYSSVRPFEDVDYATYDQKYMEESKKIQAPPLRPRGSWHQDELWALGNWN